MAHRLLGYNTNGFQSHRLEDCLDVLAACGYQSVALTPDRGHLDPYRIRPGEVAPVKRQLETLGLASVIETGARYIIDPFRKHHPTLISYDREKRIDFLGRCIEIGAELEAEVVTFFSGRPHLEIPREDQWKILAEGVAELVEKADEVGIKLGFEPEPGMLADKLEHYHKVVELSGCRQLGLTMDLGHVPCTEEISIPEALEQYAPHLVNLHIEDIRGSVHEHLPFGEGDIDFPPVFEALKKVDSAIPLHVELSRHSHAAPTMARESMDFLRRYL